MKQERYSSKHSRKIWRKIGEKDTKTERRKIVRHLRKNNNHLPQKITINKI
jgi:hypothetical protein